MERDCTVGEERDRVCNTGIWSREMME